MEANKEVMEINTEIIMVTKDMADIINNNNKNLDGIYLKYSLLIKV